MLASSLREEAQATVSNKPGHRGEHEGNRKTIARGMPGETGVTVVTMLVCFFISHARLRAHQAPGIPCALVSWAEGFMHNSGASRRGNAESYFEIVATSLRGATCPPKLNERRRKRRSNPPFVIAGWSEGPDLRC